MSEPAVRAELQITFKDQATAGLKSVAVAAEQTASKSAKAAEQAASKSTKAAEQAASKSVAAAQKQHDSHIRLYQEIATARERLGVRSEQIIRDEIHKTESAYQQLARAGVSSARELARAQEASIAKVRELRLEMGETTKTQKLQAVGQRYAPVAAGAVAGGVVGYSVIKAVVDKTTGQEQAFTELRISMTDKNNQVSGNYAKTLGQSVELGNKLPGNTRDFVLEAQALKQKGITESAIVNGGLKAAGYLRVGMGMHGEGEAGELVAKEMHSFGLKDNELVGAADHTYRMYKAFGTKSAEIQYANQYMGGDLNMLGWTGMDNMKKVQAMQGMMAMRGQDSSVFGTHFGDMLRFAANNQTRLKGNGAITKEVNETLGAHGIKLDFFDKQGKFVSPEGFMKQLEKLQVLNQKEQIATFHKLFGIGSDTAIALVAGGSKGVKEAEDKVDNMLSLTESVKQLTETLAGKREALSGSVDNAMAAAGEPIGEMLKPVLDVLNDFAGTATTFFQKNPISATLTVLSASAVAAAGAAGLVSMFLRGGVGLPVRVVNPGMAGTGPILPGGANPGNTRSSRMMGKFGLAASVGGAVLSQFGDEDNAAVRYASAALSGAGLGAMFGPIGAVIGAAGGLAIQGIMDGLKPHEVKPSESHVKIDLNLPPGATVKSQTMQANGPVKTWVNTGSVWSIP